MKAALYLSLVSSTCNEVLCYFEVSKTGLMIAMNENRHMRRQAWGKSLLCLHNLVLLRCFWYSHTPMRNAMRKKEAMEEERQRNETGAVSEGGSVVCKAVNNWVAK